MAFKCCTLCRKSWKNRDDFISSNDIRLHGYQARFAEPQKGVFLFTHIDRKCGTTMGIRVEKFIDMYHGPIYKEAKTGTAECLSRCLNISDLDRCDAKCSMAHIREIMQIIKSYKKKIIKRPSASFMKPNGKPA